jgi:RNA polymerase sigma-70 factor (ECF subfamily)
VSLISVGERSVVDSASAMAETDRVERAFRRLPLDQRTVLVLQHYLDLSHVEIAETLGIPLGTVKSRLRYGVAAMRAELDADDRVPSQANGMSA